MQNGPPLVSNLQHSSLLKVLEILEIPGMFFFLFELELPEIDAKRTPISFKFAAFFSTKIPFVCVMQQIIILILVQWLSRICLLFAYKS